MLQQEGFGADTWKNFLALERLRLCDSSGLGVGLPCLQVSRGGAAGAGPSSWKGSFLGPCGTPQAWQPPHLRRFRMGRKYLEVLTAKMTLGIRRKAHQPRQNQKAFCSRGGEVSAPCPGTGVFPPRSAPPVPPLTQCGARGRLLS